MCKPDGLHILNGTDKEDAKLKANLVASGTITPLTKYEGCYLARTDPKDVARVESKTFICTPNERETVPHHAEGVKGMLGNWISPKDLDAKIQKLFPGCMKGRHQLCSARSVLDVTDLFFCRSHHVLDPVQHGPNKWPILEVRHRAD